MAIRNEEYRIVTRSDGKRVLASVWRDQAGKLGYESIIHQWIDKYGIDDGIAIEIDNAIFDALNKSVLHRSEDDQ